MVFIHHLTGRDLPDLAPAGREAADHLAVARQARAAAQAWEARA